MADWVHCNKCMSQPSSGVRLHITNCGHIYCEECVESSTSPKCLVCDKQCNAIPLAAPLKPPIDSFFMDPVEIIKENQIQLQQVFEFQKAHRLRLFASLKEKDRLVQRCSDEIRRLASRVNDLENENASLKQSLRHSSGGGVGDHYRVAYLPQSVSPYYQPRPQPMAISPNNLVSSSKNSVSPGPTSSVSMSYQSMRAHTRSAPTTPTNRHEYISQSPITPTKTLIGASRLSVRGPPSDGKLGVVSPTPAKPENTQTAIPAGVRASRSSPNYQHQHQTTLERMATSTSPANKSPSKTESLPSRAEGDSKKPDDRYIIRRKPWQNR